MPSDACIYTVANRVSQYEYKNLVHSIRASGCTLDIVLIPFGGKPVDDPFILSQVHLLPLDSFPLEALSFLSRLGEVLKCPEGFLRRFLVFYGPYNRFIYTDNDVVALANWQLFIDRLRDYDLVHADQEYTTAGRYNFRSSRSLVNCFGVKAHEAAITAGHFAARKSPLLNDSLIQALQWMENHSSDCFLHDQTLLQLASLHGKWNCMNLCKPPNNWLSTWARDHENSLDLILKIQAGNPISHLHYSGGPIDSFEHPIDELLLSILTPRQRLRVQMYSGFKSFSGLNYLNALKRRLRRKFAAP